MRDKRVDKLNDDIHQLIKNMTIEFMFDKPHQSVGEAVETMLQVSHAVAINYASSLCATAGAIAQMRKEDGEALVPSKLLVELIEEELEGMAAFARQKLEETLNEVETAEPDPNWRLRAEILETKNAKS